MKELGFGVHNVVVIIIKNGMEKIWFNSTVEKSVESNLFESIRFNIFLVII